MMTGGSTRIATSGSGARIKKIKAGDFSPASPLFSSKSENNESYTLLVYPVDGGEEDTDRIDWDTIVAGASMDAWDIWESKKKAPTNKISE